MSDPNKPTPQKRLALFFDGTWNEPGDNTNVWRLYSMTADQGADGLRQLKYYDPGVGTLWRDRLTGGAFGAGLLKNVREGYRWLMEHYDEGDDVFFFGFSRGAFTARSLAGVIARCGLLRPDAPMSFTQLFERYKRGDGVSPIYELKFFPKKPQSQFDFEERVLVDRTWYGRDMIRMVGVWDTVGSIGIPFGRIPGVSRNTLRFHNTHLSTIVQHSYQALALDEYRKPYWAILWTNFTPKERSEPESESKKRRWVEQRWFSGAHANVGGGYASDLLPNRPLHWMRSKAEALKLGFRCPFHIDDADLEMRPKDSYSEFLHGLWKVIKFGKRYVRWVKSKPVEKEMGWVETVNERIDPSVFLRCQRYRDYRPLGLNEWARRGHIDLEQTIASDKTWPRYCSPVTGPGLESAVDPRREA